MEEPSPGLIWRHTAVADPIHQQKEYKTNVILQENQVNIISQIYASSNVIYDTQQSQK
jgi:hypothetical protein